MILVCGGLADPVTELVCARLEHSRYPYRLLDLAVYPAGFLVNWLWRGGFPAGYISNTYWRLDLRELTSVYVRFLGSAERTPPGDLPVEVLPSFYAECDAGITALLESLPCPVVNRLAGPCRTIASHTRRFGFDVVGCVCRLPLLRAIPRQPPVLRGTRRSGDL